MASNLVLFSPLAKDGIWGKTTIKAMQIFLKHHGFYPQSYLIDGIVGYWTALGMQKYLRSRGYYPANKYKLDGEDGGATWAAINKMVSKYYGNSGFIMYDGWRPYHPPKVWDCIAMLQRWMNDHRYK